MLMMGQSSRTNVYENQKVHTQFLSDDQEIASLLIFLRSSFCIPSVESVSREVKLNLISQPILSGNDVGAYFITELGLRKPKLKARMRNLCGKNCMTEFEHVWAFFPGTTSQ